MSDRAETEPTRKAPAGPRRVALFLLALATAVGSAGLAAGGTAGALLGMELAGTEAAGLPLGALVVGQAASAVLVSRGTAQIGRGRSLALGYVLGIVGAAVVILAALGGSFAALLAGSAALGTGNTAVFMARYAAAEAGGAARGRALGVVLFSTALGAVASPGLLGPSGEAARAVGLPPLAGLYLVAILCFGVAALLLSAASNPKTPYLGRGARLLGPPRGPRVTRGEIVVGMDAPSARVAVLALAATNLVMVAVMAVAPVHLVAHDGYGLGPVGIFVGLHVAGMFAPSPVSGWAADRVGPAVVVGGGFLLMAASGFLGVLLDTGGLAPMALVLLALGVGWNLGVVGGSAMLAGSVPRRLRARVEGIGEVSMGLAAGAGAPIAGPVVAFGGFAALSLAGALVATTAALALALARRP